MLAKWLAPAVLIWSFIKKISLACVDMLVKKNRDLFSDDEVSYSIADYNIHPINNKVYVFIPETGASDIKNIAGEKPCIPEVSASKSDSEVVFVSVKGLDDNGSRAYNDIVSAIDYVTNTVVRHNIKYAIVNMFISEHPPHKLVEQAVKRAEQHGIYFCIASRSSSDTDLDNDIGYPAQHAGGLSAIAPGTRVLSSDFHGRKPKHPSGTSMKAPDKLLARLSLNYREDLEKIFASKLNPSDPKIY